MTAKARQSIIEDLNALASIIGHGYIDRDKALECVARIRGELEFLDLPADPDYLSIAMREARTAAADVLGAEALVCERCNERAVDVRGVPECRVCGGRNDLRVGR